ncbi:MAG: alpha/beta hydrolase [Novosphingobium sp.]|nr:alpha/beta hydrolase [Novosphingobium sp.]
MAIATTTSGVRRIECSVPAGELLPGEPFRIGLRVVLPPDGTPATDIAFYCVVGGQMSLAYFDLGEGDDRRFSMAEALARRGHVVVLADHPGISSSTMPEDEWDLTPDLIARAHAAAARTALDGLRQGSLVPGLDAMSGLVAVGLGHSMGAVMTIEVEAVAQLYSGIVLLGYGTGGLPDILPPEAVEKARDIEWLRGYLPELVRERFGTARLDPETARKKRRGREGGSPSFHSDYADPDGKAALRGAAAPLLTLPGLFSMFPGVSDEASSRIAVPILVVTGTHDFIEAGEALLEQFSTCPRLDIIRPEDTGHNLFIFPSRTESFAQISDWATGLKSG